MEEISPYEEQRNRTINKAMNVLGHELELDYEQYMLIAEFFHYIYDIAYFRGENKKLKHDRQLPKTRT